MKKVISNYTYTLTNKGYDFLEDTLSFFISNVDEDLISEYFSYAVSSYFDEGVATFDVTNEMVDQPEYFTLTAGVDFVATRN